MGGDDDGGMSGVGGGGGEFGHLKLNTGKFKELYKVGSILGEGAFGQVRLATDKEDGGKWAVKIIEKSKVDPGDHSLQTEIDILCRVDNPYCVCLKEWFDEPKRVLLVMEFVTGGTLFDRIVNTGRFNEEDGRKAFRELAGGLAYLHDMGVAHRDLKPENFMLSSNKSDAVIKLTDYGLSKILSDPGGGAEQTVCGTPSYVAPEILNCLNDGGSYNAVTADAWSLGCNLYILLSGYPPFWRFDDNQHKLFEHIMKNDWAFDQPCWLEISDDAKSLITALMEPDLSKRLSVRNSMAHRWCGSKAAETNLPSTLANIKKHVLARRFKKAGLVVMAKSRFAAMGGCFAGGSSVEESFTSLKK
mmetsp:Transcript_39401/g.97569  ORF Transcript_39401/g.97569 Transcript_39401/m.97569 type:complete len:359 (+) Transcript_39401:407-1483(+)|eukprot:CAMPEP_0197583990 /NCGR_PEP_ID=MMETSP1326-20131121/6730_1 /TAXON_ID=1155430 /ORGANISM="Genus nov. species nov., Strain RCC2288" /LENGTH=358 /DNA_ID=CAMNT_0043148285 /DNA_START=336 /DNA_END=1412 /DNA_ORIENTATION=-